MHRVEDRSAHGHPVLVEVNPHPRLPDTLLDVGRRDPAVRIIAVMQGFVAVA
jgi:hypothetical protein